MEISFLKIKHTPIDIDYSKDSAKIVGIVDRVDRDSVKLSSRFNASITLTCNRCGKEYKQEFSYPLELILSEGRYNSNKEIDVIEFFNGSVDFDYIINSEISSIKEDYNFCIDCKDSEDILEIEF